MAIGPALGIQPTPLDKLATPTMQLPPKALPDSLGTAITRHHQSALFQNGQSFVLWRGRAIKRTAQTWNAKASAWKHTGRAPVLSCRAASGDGDKYSGADASPEGQAALERAAAAAQGITNLFPL
jgi:hypothetical protein